MGKQKFSKMINKVGSKLVEHSPEILTCLGIAGMWTTVIFAAKATPRAINLLQDAEIKKVDDQVLAGKEPDEIVDKLTPFEVVKATWKCYIPTLIMGGVSTACLIGGNSEHLKRNAALATAYTLSETALKEYQEKVIETIGEKKEQVIHEAIAKDKVEKDPVTKREVIITGNGTTRCYDAISGRYFESNVQNIRTAESTLNKRLINEMYISLNEFYWEVGLEGTELGDQLGWKIENGGIDLNLSSHLCDDGIPCLVVDYRIAPKYYYNR